VTGRITFLTVAAAASIVTAAPVASACPESTCRLPLPEQHHEDAVIDLALAVIGQPVNPVELVDAQEIERIFARLRAGAPPTGLIAFRPAIGSREPIYVSRDSDVYRSAARQRSPLALLRLAATIVHEQVHNSDGEHAAYRVQSDFVRSRLHTLPARQQGRARQYLRVLESRAASLGHAERVLRERRSARPRVPTEGQARLTQPSSPRSAGRPPHGEPRAGRPQVRR
jgi:hypothetical protein